ncbi:MAG TPA: signal peptidase II [Thermoanaerobaculia bacterium]|nr:signal peptidase II [Thermoanaerobaculia bacterium]HUM29095.1 signal peptidase II [Thermoanaerobaculia bacterium]HXK67472.1 signal peptidase II [Thermoanaerobaculia bacterium]
MKRFIPWMWTLTLVLIALDRVTKILILHSDSLPATIIPGFFTLVHVTNTGIAFGVFSGISPSIMNPVLTGIGILVLIFLAYFLLFQDETVPVRIAMHLLLAGAAGNIWDRMAYGKVIDFIDLHLGNHHWPSFNIADASISTGLILILILSFRKSTSRVPQAD